MAAREARWLKIKEWWGNLAPREQQAVAIGGTALSLFIFYQFFWSPYLNHIEDMRKQIRSAEKNLVWMVAADQQIKKVEGQATIKTSSISPVVLLSYLQKQITKAKLDLNLGELKQSGNDAVEIHFQKVSFDKLVALLIKTGKEQPVFITQMSVIASTTPGIVNADVMLKVG